MDPIYWILDFGCYVAIALHLLGATFLLAGTIVYAMIRDHKIYTSKSIRYGTIFQTFAIRLFYILSTCALVIVVAWFLLVIEFYG